MFETGIARRSQYRLAPPVHIIVKTGGDPETYCTGAPALVETPIMVNIDKRLCRRCLAALRTHDDAANVLAGLGSPWPVS